MSRKILEFICTTQCPNKCSVAFDIYSSIKRGEDIDIDVPESCPLAIRHERYFSDNCEETEDRNMCSVVLVTHRQIDYVDGLLSQREFTKRHKTHIKKGVEQVLEDVDGVWKLEEYVLEYEDYYFDRRNDMTMFWYSTELTLVDESDMTGNDYQLKIMIEDAMIDWCRKFKMRKRKSRRKKKGENS